MRQKKLHVFNRKVAFISAELACILVFTAFFFNEKTHFIGKQTFAFKNNSADQCDIDSDDFVKILDVGEGDSILICSNGYSALIDTGKDDTVQDVFDDLNSAGVKKIDTMLVTHYHDDHDGAADNIAEKYRIDNLILPKQNSDNESDYSTNKAKQKIVSEGGAVYYAVQGMNFNIGDFKITVLACFSDLAEENNHSSFVMAEKDGIKFLFTGDAEEKAETNLLKEGLNLDCDVLKVGHHGSNTSTSEAFLKATTPEYAAISVGKNNKYSHPGKQTLNEINRIGAKTYRM